MKESKDIKKVIESYPDYLVIDIHEILVAFQSKDQKETERLISDIYRTDFGKIVLTTTDYIKHNKLEELHKAKVDELNQQGYSKGAIDILAGVLTCGFDKELNWDALEVFSKKYYAMSDEEKERIKNEKKERIVHFFSEMCAPLEIPFPISFILRLILVAFLIAIILGIAGIVIAIPVFWVLSFLGLV